ncbi:MAG: hypothetical protein ACI9PC_001541, partial [Porticoccaceae bacterium]
TNCGIKVRRFTDLSTKPKRYRWLFHIDTKTVISG